MPLGASHQLQVSLMPYAATVDDGSNGLPSFDPAIPLPPRDAIDNPDLAWVCGRVMRPLGQHEVGKRHGWTAEQWMSADNQRQVAGKPMYYNHKARSMGAIGSLHSPYVDSENWLCVCGYINRTDERAATIYERMRRGEVCDLSIGYDVEYRNAATSSSTTMISRIIIKEVSVTEKGKIEGSRITYLNSAVSQGDDDNDVTCGVDGSANDNVDNTVSGASTKANVDTTTSLLDRYRRCPSSALFATSASTSNHTPMSTAAVANPLAGAAAPAAQASSLPTQQPPQQAPATTTPTPTVAAAAAGNTQAPPVDAEMGDPQQQQSGSDAASSMPLTDIDLTNHEEVVKLAMSLLQERRAKEEADAKAFAEQNQTVFQQVATVLKAHGLPTDDSKAQAFFVDRGLAHLNQPMLRVAQQNLELQQQLAKAQEERRVLEETVRGMQGVSKRPNNARQTPSVAANAARAALDQAQHSDKPSALAQTTGKNAPAPTTPQDQATDMRKLLDMLQKRSASLPRMAADAHVGAYHPLDPYRIDPSKPLDLTKEAQGHTVSVRNSALTQIEDSILTPEMVAHATATPLNTTVSRMPKTFACGSFAAYYGQYRPNDQTSPFAAASSSMEATSTGTMTAASATGKPPIQRGIKRGNDVLVQTE